MGRIGSKNTTPEIVVRSLLHSMGYRFRLHRKDLPGKPDIILPGRQKAIFVHGCFWHGHGCRIGQPPKSNPEFWLPKIERNRVRDEANLVALQAAGWDTAVVWQCEIKHRVALREHLVNFLGPPPQISINTPTITG